MHLPSGLLGNQVCVVTQWMGATSAAFAAVALRHAKIPFRALALGAGLMLTMQSLNFPVGPGHSAHLLGTTAVTLLFGAGPAIVLVGAVLLVQAVVFADGSLLTWGANLLNMGVLPALIAASGRNYVTLESPLRRRVGVTTLAAVGGVLAAVTACACELAISTNRPLSEVFLTLLSAHAVLLFCEALFTICLVELSLRQTSTSLRWKWLLPAFAGCLAMIPLSSTLPDGLEWSLDRLSLVNIAGSEAGSLGVCMIMAAIAVALVSGWKFAQARQSG